MTRHDEERIGQLLRRLSPAPEGWVQAAQELPRARQSLDRIVSLAEADAAFRRAVLADLEAALRETGVEPSELLLDELRRRLAA